MSTGTYALYPPSFGIRDSMFSSAAGHMAGRWPGILQTGLSFDNTMSSGSSG
jgi:hypothetical protein